MSVHILPQTDRVRRDTWDHRIAIASLSSQLGGRPHAGGYDREPYHALSGWFLIIDGKRLGPVQRQDWAEEFFHAKKAGATRATIQPLQTRGF